MSKDNNLCNPRRRLLKAQSLDQAVNHSVGVEIPKQLNLRLLKHCSWLLSGVYGEVPPPFATPEEGERWWRRQRLVRALALHLMKAAAGAPGYTTSLDLLSRALDTLVGNPTPTFHMEDRVLYWNRQAWRPAFVSGIHCEMPEKDIVEPEQDMVKISFESADKQDEIWVHLDDPKLRKEASLTGVARRQSYAFQPGSFALAGDCVYLTLVEQELLEFYRASGLSPVGRVTETLLAKEAVLVDFKGPTCGGRYSEPLFMKNTSIQKIKEEEFVLQTSRLAVVREKALSWLREALASETPLMVYRSVAVVSGQRCLVSLSSSMQMRQLIIRVLDMWLMRNIELLVPEHQILDISNGKRLKQIEDMSQSEKMTLFQRIHSVLVMTHGKLCLKEDASMTGKIESGTPKEEGWRFFSRTLMFNQLDTQINIDQSGLTELEILMRPVSEIQDLPSYLITIQAKEWSYLRFPRIQWLRLEEREEFGIQLISKLFVRGGYPFYRSGRATVIHCKSYVPCKSMDLGISEQQVIAQYNATSNRPWTRGLTFRETLLSPLPSKQSVQHVGNAEVWTVSHELPFPDTNLGPFWRDARWIRRIGGEPRWLLCLVTGTLVAKGHKILIQICHVMTNSWCAISAGFEDWYTLGYPPLPWMSWAQKRLMCELLCQWIAIRWGKSAIFLSGEQFVPATKEIEGGTMPLIKGTKVMAQTKSDSDCQKKETANGVGDCSTSQEGSKGLTENKRAVCSDKVTDTSLKLEKMYLESLNLTATVDFGNRVVKVSDQGCSFNVCVTKMVGSEEIQQACLRVQEDCLKDTTDVDRLLWEGFQTKSYLAHRIARQIEKVSGHWKHNPHKPVIFFRKACNVIRKGRCFLTASDNGLFVTTKLRSCRGSLVHQAVVPMEDWVKVFGHLMHPWALATMGAYGETAWDGACHWVCARSVEDPGLHFTHLLVKLEGLGVMSRSYDHVRRRTQDHIWTKERLPPSTPYPIHEVGTFKRRKDMTSSLERRRKMLKILHDTMHLGLDDHISEGEDLSESSEDETSDSSKKDSPKKKESRKQISKIRSYTPPTPCPKSPRSRAHSCEIMKVKDLGLLLEDDNENKWVLITQVSQSAPSHIRQRLKAGDRILSVQNIHGRDLEDAALLREALERGGSNGQVLKLRFLRGEGKPETDSEVSEEEPEEDDHQNNISEECLGSSASRPPSRRSRPQSAAGPRCICCGGAGGRGHGRVCTHTLRKCQPCTIRRSLRERKEATAQAKERVTMFAEDRPVLEIRLRLKFEADNRELMALEDRLPVEVRQRLKAEAQARYKMSFEDPLYQFRQRRECWLLAFEDLRFQNHVQQVEKKAMLGEDRPPLKDRLRMAREKEENKFMTLEDRPPLTVRTRIRNEARERECMSLEDRPPLEERKRKAAELEQERTEREQMAVEDRLPLEERQRLDREAEKQERYFMAANDERWQAEETDEEDDFICDICEKEIDIFEKGRFSCLVCEEYDVCVKCNRKLHAAPIDFEKGGHKVWHLSVHILTKKKEMV